MSKLSDQALVLREAKKIADALAQTFAPLCEVVVHDFTDPDHAIVQIGNNLSGRAVGDSVTPLGLARISDPTFPDIVANYANTFADGRPAKSTSIGLRDKSGKFVGAICLNLDLSFLQSISGYLNELTKINPTSITEETRPGKPRSVIYAQIMTFAAERNKEPRSLTAEQKRQLILELEQAGVFERRGAADQIGAIIGISRSNVYYYLKSAKSEGTAKTR